MRPDPAPARPERHAARGIALRVAAGGLALVIGWWMLGPYGLVFAAPLVALALAGPLLSTFVGSGRLARRLALEPLGGRYFEYRGHPVAVWEDIDEVRWLRAADVRGVLPGFPRDEVLARVMPEGTTTPAEGGGLHVRADRLLEFFAKAEQPEALRFKLWVQREVHLPSGSARRAGLGPTARARRAPGEPGESGAAGAAGESRATPRPPQADGG